MASLRPLLRPLLRRSRQLCTARPFPTSDNFYALLGLPETFGVSSSQLSSRFKALQQQWHPDRFGASSAPEQRRAAAMSARINEAYHTLREPSARAKHLLRIRGQHDLHHDQLDPAFLAWVVDTRESIAEASDDPQRLNAINDHNARAIRQCLADLAAAFEHANLKAAATHTAKLQYLRRIEAAIAGADDLVGES